MVGAFQRLSTRSAERPKRISPISAAPTLLQAPEEADNLPPLRGRQARPRWHARPRISVLQKPEQNTIRRLPHATGAQGRRIPVAFRLLAVALGTVQEEKLPASQDRVWPPFVRVPQARCGCRRTPKRKSNSRAICRFFVAGKRGPGKKTQNWQK